MLPQEIEIKLDLQNSENYNRLIKQLGVSENPSRQQNYFFDTADWTLSKNGWALRIRKEGAENTISLKGTGSHSADGLTTRTEIETSIEEDDFDKYYHHGLDGDQIPDSIRRIICSIINNEHLNVKVEFVNYRLRADFSGENIKMLFEIDRTIFSNGLVDYELEIELDSQLAGEKALGEVTSFLDSLNIEAKFQKKSKFARALAAENINPGSTRKWDHIQ